LLWCFRRETDVHSPPPAPVDRLLANENQIVKTHPDDPVGYYTLGPIRYLAFSLGAKRLSVSKNGKTGVEVDGSYPGRQTWGPKGGNWWGQGKMDRPRSMRPCDR
jgi:hypothetical protein